MGDGRGPSGEGSRLLWSREWQRLGQWGGREGGACERRRKKRAAIVERERN